jgi:hypothetical protein
MSSSEVSRLSRRLNLLTVANAKTTKGQAKGYATAILYLAPAWESGHNTCAKHTTECAEACLFSAGRGAMQNVIDARLRKTRMFFEERAKFLDLLDKDIEQFAANAAALDYEPAIRLNGTSDIRWEKYGVPQRHPRRRLYDYTKLTNRRDIPANYHLTFSYSGDNLADCMVALANGINVAAPFMKPPKTWLGYPVVDGDEDDLRFLNNETCVLALKPKGKLRSQPQSKFLGDNWAA